MRPSRRSTPTQCPGLREELGDVLLQVMLHSEIASEAGHFTVDDVIEGLVNKLIRRHPHVFGDADARTAEEVAARWEVLKSEERHGASLMEGVPANLPALTYAQRTQGRAANVGFDWPNIDGVLAKVAEEATELSEAADTESIAMTSRMLTPRRNGSSVICCSAS